MTAAQRKSRPGEEAADRHKNAASAYGQEVRKASAPPPWFRLDAAKWRSMTVDLKPAERGILVDLLVQIHQRGEPVPNDPARLARACGTTQAAFKHALAAFIADGRVVLRGGKLWSIYVEAELENFEKRSQVGKENASKRWGKTQQNQSDDDATAMRYRDDKIVEGAPMEPPSYTDISSEYDTDAHESASGHHPVQFFNVGDKIALFVDGKEYSSQVNRVGIDFDQSQVVKAPAPYDFVDADWIVPIGDDGRVRHQSGWWAGDEPRRTDCITWSAETVEPPIPAKRKGRSHAA